jgi:hypothetical protein
MGGETRPLPLGELRRRIEADQPNIEPLFDAYDWGGCGCMTDMQMSAEAVTP